ncbi:hypothetical protein VKT23_018734 [Stygiomarasmius scandens]|uniref:Uncharacterized protein n=1 Tax=Marasmiellus scandens TaxID=2682957 RepID=A0ABR1IRL5_9AGAR
MVTGFVTGADSEKDVFAWDLVDGYRDLGRCGWAWIFSTQCFSTSCCYATAYPSVLPKRLRSIPHHVGWEYSFPSFSEAAGIPFRSLSVQKQPSSCMVLGYLLNSESTRTQISVHIRKGLLEWLSLDDMHTELWAPPANDTLWMPHALRSSIEYRPDLFFSFYLSEPACFAALVTGDAIGVYAHMDLVDDNLDRWLAIDQFKPGLVKQAFISIPNEVVENSEPERDSLRLRRRLCSMTKW